LKLTGRRLALIVGIVLAGAATVYLAGPLFYDIAVQEALPEASGSPTVVYGGSFRDADDFHRASGTAQILRSANGTHYLRFEEFRVTNGPDLFVYLGATEDVDQAFLDLGRLKGNVGDQNYQIPADADLIRYRTVIIWCRAFSVPFGYATLSTS
jgi:hypothetical protein